MGSNGSSGGFFKSLFVVLMLLGLLWLMLVGVFETESNMMVISPRQGESLKPKGELMNGRNNAVGVLNMSKRRVPHGADPIHNRRAGNSRQPPGRA